MHKEFWNVAEIIEIFEVDERFLAELEEQEILCPTCVDDLPTRQYASSELEKLRLAKILVEDMGVNLPGVEIILRMRQHTLEMRRQFDVILEDIARAVRESLKETR